MKELDITKPLRRRDGGEFKIWRKSGDRILGSVTERDGSETPQYWTLEGTFFDDRSGCGLDLLPAPRMVKVDCGWKNVYVDASMSVWSTSYNTREEADEAAFGNNRFACIHIEREVEEGEGL